MTANFIHQNIQSIRQQFPALGRTQNDTPLVFFDGPAGTQVPQRVIDAVSHYYANSNANTGGQFVTSLETGELTESVRAAYACFVGCKDPDEVVFGQNMTSLTYSISRSIANTWKPGDEVVVTRLDHDANVYPWVQAAQEKGVVVKFVDFHKEDCSLDLEHFQSCLNEKTKLVAIGAACNATGGINPVKQLTRWAHDAGALVFVDAVHYAPHALIDIEEWGCDFLACSTYKFFGPHLGVLWGRRELLEAFDAFQVRPAGTRIPGKWQTGTQSFEAMAGAKAALEYLCSLAGNEQAGNELTRNRIKKAFEVLVDYEQALTKKVISVLSSDEQVTIYGITANEQLDQRTPTFSIKHQMHSTRELARLLAESGIFVWEGHYYALEFVRRLGLESEGLVRIGLVHYNTLDEISRLGQSLSSLKPITTVSS